MNLTFFAQAPHYTAPNHIDMRCLRLQGHEAGPSQSLWVGLSQILPGGHTGLDASQMEKHYVVIEGELTLISELAGQTMQAVLGPNDSVCFEPGEKRQLLNRTNRTVSVLLAMPYPPTVPRPQSPVSYLSLG